MNLSPQSKAILNNAVDRYTAYLNNVLQVVNQLPAKPEEQGDYVLLPKTQYQALLAARDVKRAA